MAPFFFIFFGMMTGDIMYGLMITFFSWYILKKSRPAEGSTIKRLLQLSFLCSFSCIIWGALFGAFFGNAIPAFTGAMLGREIKFSPILFDPLSDPMSMFLLSLGWGFVHVGFGMCLKAYQFIRCGQISDAVADVGFRLCILYGAPLYFLSANAGLAVMIIGALGIICTGGRKKSNIFMKIMGGFGSLYSCVNYLSDILSYSRLLGLGLASAVIAQVMNTIATLGGSSVAGWILFVVVFIVGHIFNLLINLLGIFVHSARLQFIEFYGKFYEPGGRIFAPLFNKTKYVEMVKEVI
jgi:V/A-type H+-transporting ATPase subunit I